MNCINAVSYTHLDVYKRQELGLPTTLQELGVADASSLGEIADSCGISAGSYKKMTHEEILEIFNECLA